MVRYRLPRSPIDFVLHVLVECPRCEDAAEIVAAENTLDTTLTCAACGLILQRKRRFAWLRGPTNRLGLDPYFGLPLWLRESVGREVVWAYDWRHLEDLEFFIQGEWKAHRHGLAYSREHPNWSYRTRYPKWVHKRGNQVAILKALARIRKRRR